LGGLFEVIKDELIEKNVAERLWELFEELLQTVINAIAESAHLIRNSVEYQYLKGLFEDSFLGNQLKQLDNVA